MTVPDKLRDVYLDPHGHARAWKAESGRKVVGCLGLDVPHELVEAAGMLPVRVLPHPDAPLEAVAGLCEGASGPVMSSLAARLLDGTYDYLDYLVISTRPTFHIELHALLRELHRSGSLTGGPEIRLFDFHHDAKASTQRFNMDSVRALKRDLETWSGAPITDAVLQSAVQTSNRNRILLGRLDALRTEHRLLGSELLVLTETGNLMARHLHNSLLQHMLDTEKDARPLEGVPVVYSGSDTDDLRTYQAIEAAGAHIVADDQDRGTRQLAPLIAEHGDPMEAIEYRYRTRSPSSSGYRTGERIDFLTSLTAAKRPHAVVFHSVAADHPTGWDYPALRDAVERLGTPTLHLGARRYREPGAEQLTVSVREFIRQLRMPRPPSSEAQTNA